MLRGIDLPTLRVAWWTLRCLRSARRQLRAVTLAEVVIADPPRVSGAAVRGMSAMLRRRDDSCLERALVRQRWHRSQGRERDLVIGVSPTGPDFAAHAWLEGDPAAGHAGYRELSRLPTIR